MKASSRGTRSCRSSYLGVVSAALLIAACGEEGTVAGGRTADAALTVDHVVPTGQVCAPTGKHFEHRTVDCATCHQCAGTVSFNGAIAGATAAFDATTKNCSNVACHTVPAGTFTYTVWDWGTEELVPVTVPYGGQPSPTPPSWYAAVGQGCGACHGYPPRYNGSPYQWHSGTHGMNVATGNACQLCHPDATGAYVFGGPPNYTGTSGGLVTSCPPGSYCAGPGTITNAALHRNGVVDVAPRWGSNCLGCH